MASSNKPSQPIARQGPLRSNGAGGRSRERAGSSEVRRQPSSRHRLETRIEIHTSAERVWSILMDFPGYPRWNPFVRSIEGVAVVGEALRVLLQLPGSRGMRFRPRVIAMEPARELRWKGRLLIPGLFDGEHYFVLEPQSDARVVFCQGEVFSGVVAPLFMRSIAGPTRQGFIAMNEALKREAEGQRG